MELGDGAHTVSLNACGTVEDVSPELKAFLDFVMGKPSDAPFVRTLEARVREVKQNPDWRREFMVLFMRDQDKIEEGREQGLAQGLAQGREQGFIQALVGLVKDGLLPLKEALARAQMTEAEFTAQMRAYAS